jgi:hypothetical protein
MSGYNIKPKELKNWDLAIKEQPDNALEFLCKINLVRYLFGKPLINTSYFRTAADQQRINPNAPLSNHRLAIAGDFAGTELYYWLDKHKEIMQDIGIWCESIIDAPTWTHIQFVPPKSGNLFFRA